MTRAASLLLRVLGLTFVLVGLMGFVLLGADGTWTARTEIPAGRTAVLLEPSVVSVLGTDVTVRVEPSVDEDDAPVAAGLAPPAGYFLGRGRTDDLTTYARSMTVSRVVGLARSRELEVREGWEQSPAAVGLPFSVPGPAAPTAVDVWQQQVTGLHARELTWRPTPGAQSVLVAREDGTPLPALSLEVAWTDRTWLWMPTVALVLGLALIVGGLMLGDALPSVARVWPGTRGPRRERPLPEAQPDGEDATIAAVPSETDEPAPGGADSAAAAPTVVATTRRAARGRRRKQTVWDKVWPRSQSERRTTVGRKRDRA